MHPFDTVQSFLSLHNFITLLSLKLPHALDHCHKTYAIITAIVSAIVNKMFSGITIL